MPRGRRGTASFVRGNSARRGKGSPGRQRIRRHKPDTIDLKICRQRSRCVLRSGPAVSGVRALLLRARVIREQKGADCHRRRRREADHDQRNRSRSPVIPEYGTARITIHARSARGWPLGFEVAASAGSIEPTEEPNVFLWHGPKSPAPAHRPGEAARASTTRQR